MIASRSGWTPLFLNAEPKSTGVTLPASVPARSARRIISGVTALSSSRYVSVSSSSNSATASMSAWCSSWARSWSWAGTVLDPELRAEGVRVRDRIHLHDVHDPVERVLLADRELDGHGGRAEPVAHRLHGCVEVRARAIHLVDERDPRNAVAVRLAPHRLGLRLDAGNRIEDGNGAVEHAQAPLDLHRKVHVPGRIDNVDPEVAPEGRRRRRGDRDAALLLLRHPVHRRGALVHLAHLVRAARVVEDPLGRRRLARVDVGHDPDVPDTIERDGCGNSRHRSAPTSGSARRPCWPAPSGRCRPSS